MAQIVANDARHVEFPRVDPEMGARRGGASSRPLPTAPSGHPSSFPGPDGRFGYGQMADRSASTSTAAAEAAWERGAGDDG
jgi:hypothetical protein